MPSQALDIIKPLMIGAVLVGLFVVVPVIALLTEHQRKMAHLLRPEGDESLREEVRALRAELRSTTGQRDLPPIPQSAAEEDSVRRPLN